MNTFLTSDGNLYIGVCEIFRLYYQAALLSIFAKQNNGKSSHARDAHSYIIACELFRLYNQTAVLSIFTKQNEVKSIHTRDSYSYIVACEIFRLDDRTAPLSIISEKDKVKSVELLRDYINNYLQYEDYGERKCPHYNGAIEDNCSLITDENKSCF